MLCRSTTRIILLASSMHTRLEYVSLQSWQARARIMCPPTPFSSKPFLLFGPGDRVRVTVPNDLYFTLLVLYVVFWLGWLYQEDLHGTVLELRARKMSFSSLLVCRMYSAVFRFSCSEYCHPPPFAHKLTFSATAKPNQLAPTNPPTA